MSVIRELLSMPVYVLSLICNGLGVGLLWLAERIEGDF